MSHDHDPFDTSEPQARQDKKRARQIEVNDIKWLMSNKAGRRIVLRLINEAGMSQLSFTGNSETFFREGRRSIGLLIEGEAKAHAWPEYLLMLNESKVIPNE